MHYYELLRKYIEDSGLKLDEIAEKLKAHGFNITKSYVSKLQNGKTARSATDELNRALASVTGGSVEELLTAALIEKAPAELKDELKNKMVRLTTMKDVNGKYKNGKERLDAANSALLEADTRIDALQEIEDIGGEHITSFIKVPLLGYIAAGQPLLAQEHIIDWEFVPNLGYKEGSLFSLSVKGDSMIGARIQEDDKVLVRIQQEVEDGEVAVINVGGEHATLKRVKRINGKILLLSENPKYKPIVISSEHARICGKVIQVIFDPNKKN